MSQKSRERWYDKLRARAAEQKAGESGEVRAQEPPSVATEVVDDDPYWMIAGCAQGRRTAFVESLGSRYGHPDPTAAYVLDRWGEGQYGLRWTLDPTTAYNVVPSSRARAILALCFSITRSGLEKLAAVDHGGDMEAAIRQAIDEQMTLFGIDA